MKLYQFKCELFIISRDENGKRIAKWSNHAKIIGKDLFISQLQREYESSNDEFFDEYSFTYTYNIPFEYEINISENHKMKVNARIEYSEIINENYINVVRYTHLTWFQKLMISCAFRNLWIQQPANVLWLIGIIITVFGIILSYSHNCHNCHNYHR